MEPTIGRIVIYKTTEAQQKAMQSAPALNKGTNVSKELPAMIVAVWGPTVVNLKVFLDGHGDIWVTSATLGDDPGQWNWPVIKK